MPNQTLVIYIKDQLKARIPKHNIEQNLQTVGWSDLEIRAAFLEVRRQELEQNWKSAGIASLLSMALLGLPELAGDGFYNLFWQQLVLVGIAGALFDTLYRLTIRRWLTPVWHPKHAHLRWLLAGPPLALLMLWLFRIPLLIGTSLSLILGLVAITFIGGSLVFDALASAIGFGILYVGLFLALRIPVTGPVETIGSFSGILFWSRPIEELGLVFLFGALWGPVCSAFHLPPERKDLLFHPRHQGWKKVAILGFLFLLFGSAYLIYNKFVHVPQAIAANTAPGRVIGNLTDPISITFDRPIDPSKLNLNIYPPVSGSISFGDAYLQPNLVREVIFTPSSHWQPGQEYKVKLTNIINILGRQSTSLTLNFQTQALPTVASFSLTPGETKVGICDPISVNLSAPTKKLVDFSFKLNPSNPITVSTSKNQPNLLIITPKGCLNQNTTYQLTVLRRLTIYASDGSLSNPTDLPEAIKEISFTTKGTPGITGFSPQGSNILGSTKQFILQFSEPMANSDPQDFLSITPPIAGSWSWKDNQTLVYNLGASLSLDTKYTVKVAQGIKDAHEGFLTQNTVFTFTTVGHVFVSRISPPPGSSGVKIGSDISISFSQPVDHDSAQRAFSITPAISGSFSWQGQKMIFSSSLSKDSSYSFSEGLGVISLIGLPSVTTTNASFQTEESVLLLNIPIYFQQHALSCEAASLHMALLYKGTNISESTIIGQIGADLTPRQNGVWGDPNLSFVGDVNGADNVTGYGVYANPIAKVASQYFPAQAVSGITVSEITSSLSMGNPVILWGTAGNRRPDAWVTPQGVKITAWVGEHARLIVGFTGSASNPHQFIINDPIYGRLFWSVSQTEANWAAFSGMAVTFN